MKKQEIIEKYKNKALSKEHWGENKEQFVDEYIDEEKLISNLWSMSESESGFTISGLDFIKEYYGGLENVAELAFKKGGFGSGLENKEEILNWLKNLEKEVINSSQEDE
jgi:hypothetical protein